MLLPLIFEQQNNGDEMIKYNNIILTNEQTTILLAGGQITLSQDGSIYEQ